MHYEFWLERTPPQLIFGTILFDHSPTLSEFSKKAGFGSNREIRDRGLFVDKWVFDGYLTINYYDKADIVRDPNFILENGWLVGLPNGTSFRLVEILDPLEYEVLPKE